MDFNLEFWVQTAITLGFGGGGIGVFTIWRDRRKAAADAAKTNAEATGTDANTAKTNQEWMADEIDRQVEAREKESKLSLIRKRAGAKLYRYMLSHESWDITAERELAKAGIQLPRPPSLQLTQEELDALEV